MGKMKKRKKNKKLVWQILMLAVTLFVVTLVLLSAKLPTDSPLYPVVMTVGAFFFDKVMVGIALGTVILIIYLSFFHKGEGVIRIGSLSHFLEENKKQLMYITTLLGMGFIYWLGEDLQRLFGPLDVPYQEKLDALLGGADLFGYYTAQLSLTFISISVMSVLSDRSVLIYWVNASEERLIKPIFSCFAAYTYYSIGATVGAGAAVLMGDGVVFMLFFCANIGILILLTISMIDVYFGRDTKKKKLRRTMIADWRFYNKEKSGKKLSAYERMRAERYETAMMGLRQTLYQSQAQADLTLLKENYELYFTCAAYFRTDPGRNAVQAMVSTVNAQSFPTFFDCLDNFVRDLPRMKKGELVMYLDDPERDTDYCWDMDEHMWAFLSRSSYLQEWIATRDLSCEDGWELMELLFVVKRRLVQLHNDMVTELVRGKEDAAWDEDDYLLAMDDDGKVTLAKGGRTLPAEDLMTVFEESFPMLMPESAYAARLLRMVLCLLRREDATEGVVAQMADFPIVNLFTAHLELVGITDEEARLLRRHFPPVKIPD